MKRLDARSIHLHLAECKRRFRSNGNARAGFRRSRLVDILEKPTADPKGNETRASISNPIMTGLGFKGQGRELR